jgi:hypothetical protein
VTASAVAFLGDQAQAGAGGAASGAGTGGAGGTAAGGAAYNGADSTLDLSDAALALGGATGGAGGSGGTGGNGGDGLGGAIFNAGPTPSFFGTLPGGTLALSDVVVTGNWAQGGAAGGGATPGTAGLGIGGGLYLSTGGTATLKKARVVGNSASTSDDNTYGIYGS